MGKGGVRVALLLGRLVGGEELADKDKTRVVISCGGGRKGMDSSSRAGVSERV